MRRFARLILLVGAVCGLALFWKANSQSLAGFKDRILAKATGIYHKLFRRDSAAPGPIPETGTIIWCGEQCFWLNRDGMLLDGAPETEGSLIKTARVSLLSEIKTGDRVLEQSEAENLYQISELMKQFGFNFSAIDLGDLSLKEATIEIASGTKFYFSLKNSPDFARPVVESLTSSGEIQGLRYIDFRMENRAYYK
ncbi:MAG: hypothetical protein M1586_01420 [Patescibacteria group bacterium]|nr:hypothetical protein [Patescibacteria group bacterium]MCL5261943.1 hypothetical protein [Patescibacteria group bacterium]